MGTSNTPDVRLVDKTTCIIEAANHHNSNLKKVNYELLAQEIKEIWYLERVVVDPIICICIPSGFPRLLRRWYSLAYIVQKYSILKMCSILRRFSADVLNNLPPIKPFYFLSIWE